MASEREIMAKAHVLGGEIREVHLTPEPNHYYWRYEDKSCHATQRHGSACQFKSAQEAFDDLVRFLTQRSKR